MRAGTITEEDAMTAQPDTCALCPRLCRHRCPVSIATGLESTTPTAIMSSLVMSSHNDDTTASLSIDLCTRCGECEAACGIDQPVVDLLDNARVQHQTKIDPWVPPTIRGEEDHVAILCAGTDWTKGLEKYTPIKLARLFTDDHLGELHSIRPDTKNALFEQLKGLLADRTAITTCKTCLTTLQAAGCSASHISQFIGDDGSLPKWRTCRCKPGHGVQTNVTCCGARAPLSTSHPEVANMVANDLRRRLDGQAVYIEDSRCSAHLKAAGMQVVDPIDRLSITE